MGKYVTLVEVGRKQSYIFASNRLAENIGASIIVRRVTEKDPQEFYKEYTVKVIYEGGGKALYVFESEADGIAFAKSYSRFILETYPGLTIYIVGCELKGDMTVKEGVDFCYALLEKKKNSGFLKMEVIDYGGTLRCAETNLPAVPHGNISLPEDRKNKPISAESMTKYRYRLEQEEYFKDILPEGWKFPTKLDQLGRSRGEKSYIAVVHIDGNRMRDKISKFNQQMERKDEETQEDFDGRYIEGLKKLSGEIDAKYREAFRELNQVLADCMEDLRKELDLPEEDEYLPIRPLIMAGDDICFVTDGRIGIEAARIFLEHIRKKTVQGIPLNACGGIAIVKAHFPFSRAYRLSEELCRNAKNELLMEEQDGSLLDWHVDQGELKDSLMEIRKQYIGEDGTYLTMKPYRISEGWDEDSIRHFQDALHILRKTDIARSKILGMRDVAHTGKKATEYYLRSNRILEELERTNWKRGEYGFTICRGKETHLFYDAMEMLDLYIELEDKVE